MHMPGKRGGWVTERQRGRSDERKGRGERRKERGEGTGDRRTHPFPSITSWDENRHL
jgi:hypothetical protein